MAENAAATAAAAAEPGCPEETPAGWHPSAAAATAAFPAVAVPSAIAACLVAAHAFLVAAQVAADSPF